MRMRKWKLASAVAVLLLVVTVVAWYFLQERGTPAHLIDLDSQSLTNLKDEFNQADNSTRLIVLLSPT